MHAPDTLCAILEKHHVFGSVTLLCHEKHTSILYNSTTHPEHLATDQTLFRVASLTKMATAAVILRLCEAGKCDLEANLGDFFPEFRAVPRITHITVRALLSHTSGLRDTPAVDQALRQGKDFTEAFTQQLSQGTLSSGFAYCNFGFGLLGCIIEQCTGLDVEACFQQLLFEPLEMRATLNAAALDTRQIMPILRVLPYRKGQQTILTALGKKPLHGPDPMRHFGYTAGSLYTDAPSIQKLLQAILTDPALKPMCERRASYGRISPTLHYGLGLLQVTDSSLCKGTIYGHQGFAYGCADGAFVTENGDMLIHLNGGASEARVGRLGLLNQDLLRWAFGKGRARW